MLSTIDMNMKNKKQAKLKEPIRIRYKALNNGNQSIYLDYYDNGKREYEFLKLYLVPETSFENRETNKTTLKLANAIKAQKIVELQNNRHGFSMGGTLCSKVNLIEYTEMLAEKKCKKAGGNTRGTCSTYLTLAYHLKKYSGEKTTFRQIDKNYCNGFIEYLKSAVNANNGQLLSQNTQWLYMKNLEAVINSAISDEITDSNPFKQIKPENKPKEQSVEVCYLTIEEVNALVNTPCFYPDVKNGFLFSCFSGLRFSDVKGLTWDKLQKDSNGNMFINYVQKKTTKQEYLPINKSAVKYLPERGEARDTDLVFKFPSSNYVNLQLRQWSFAAGIKKKVTFHVARHTNATLLLSLEVPIETVSKLLGHADIQTTQIYAKVIDKSKRDAVNKLDGLMA
jgi:integrase